MQAVGQCLYVRPFVEDFTPMWLLEQSCALTAGAMILMYIGELLNEIKLGNGTSLLIFSNIVSALPSSIGQTVSIAQEKGDSTVLPVFFGAFALTALGIVYVQEAERKIPMNYSTRFNAGGLAKSSYLPFKVNSAGVMPIIFASSLLALPATLTRFTDNGAVLGVARFLSPGGGAGYVPVNVAMICFFNYFYTFLQLEPKDVADQLKRQGASIPGVRPGAAHETTPGGPPDEVALAKETTSGRRRGRRRHHELARLPPEEGRGPAERARTTRQGHRRRGSQETGELGRVGLADREYEE